MKTITLSTEQIARMVATSYKYNPSQEHRHVCGALKQACWTALGFEEGTEFFNEAAEMARDLFND